MRYTQRQPDDHNGRACTSWSNNEADKVKVPTSDDRSQNTTNNNRGILTEPNRSGLTDAVTASSRDVF